MEHGPDDGYVRQVAAPEVGIVENEQVAVVNVVAEVVPDGGPRHGKGADVNRDSLALGHQLAIAVQYGG